MLIVNSKLVLNTTASAENRVVGNTVHKAKFKEKRFLPHHGYFEIKDDHPQHFSETFPVGTRANERLTNPQKSEIKN